MRVSSLHVFRTKVKVFIVNSVNVVSSTNCIESCDMIKHGHFY